MRQSGRIVKNEMKSRKMVSVYPEKENFLMKYGYGLFFSPLFCGSVRTDLV
jgi:hypothetical protein